jgi:hypothetical protein
MEIMSVGEFTISYGESKEIVARLVPKTSTKKLRRKNGIFEGKGSVHFGKDLKITEEEFLGL